MKAYIAFGSNIPPRKIHIKKALDLLNQSKNLEVIKCSRFYETEPVGMESDFYFLNGVCEIETDIDPVGLMKLLLHIEKQIGRDRSLGMDREIDLDLLYYNNQILNEDNLILPHPRLNERKFVLEPWQEIAPDVVVAPWNKSVSQLYEALIEKTDL